MGRLQASDGASLLGCLRCLPTNLCQHGEGAAQSGLWPPAPGWHGTPEPEGTQPLPCRPMACCGGVGGRRCAGGGAGGLQAPGDQHPCRGKARGSARRRPPCDGAGGCEQCRCEAERLQPPDNERSGQVRHQPADPATVTPLPQGQSTGNTAHVAAHLPGASLSSFCRSSWLPMSMSSCCSQPSSTHSSYFTRRCPAHSTKVLHCALSYSQPRGTCSFKRKMLCRGRESLETLPIISATCCWPSRLQETG